MEGTQNLAALNRLRADITSGVLAPGQRLRIAYLNDLYGFGASALRESLAQLGSLGYVTSETRRGYAVSKISPADLADITHAREIIEIAMLRESMQRRSEEWAVNLIAATERLRLAVNRAPPDRAGFSEHIEVIHKQFHLTLVAGCESPRLAAMQSLLWDQARRYRDIVISEVQSHRKFIDDHLALTRAALKNDVEKACAALTRHLNLTPRRAYRTAQR